MSSVPVDVMNHVLEMLVNLGRVLPANRWVDELIEESRAAKWDAIARV